MKEQSNYIKTAYLVILITLFTLVVSFLFGIFIYKSNTTYAASVESDLRVRVREVLGLSLENCDATSSAVVKVSLTPNSAGVFKSNCQTAKVDTNAPGYTLTIKADTSTLNYQNPTTISPTPTIASTANTIATPAELSNDTWGFAVENNGNFDTNYSIDNASNKYAQVPTTDTSIYQTSIFPLPQTDHIFYYATRLTTKTVAGTYAATITYTAIGAVVPHSPYVIEVSPSVNMVGGDIFINGEGFYGADEQTTDAVTRVTVGGTDCSSFVVMDSETIKCVLPYMGTTDDTYAVVVTTEGPSNSSKKVTYDSENKGFMQDVTPTTCTSMPIGLAQLYTDQRVDTNTGLNHQYRVKKMQDGKCWMIDNLKFGYGTRYESGALTANREYSGTEIEESAANFDVARYLDPATVSDAEVARYCADQDNNLAGSTTKCGYLYNWYTATYGTGTFSGTPWNASGSICPNTTNSGEISSSPWRLPTGRGSVGANDFSALDIAMGGDGVGSTNISYVNTSWGVTGSWAGVFAGRQQRFTSNQGDQGWWWTSTVGGTDTVAARMFITPDSVNMASSTNPKYNGLSVRCLMNPE